MADETSREQFIEVWSQIVARTWSDAGFRRRVLDDAVGVLAEHQIEVPAGTAIQVVEGELDAAPTRPAGEAPAIVLPLPAEPADIELSDADLDAVAGGALAPPSVRRARDLVRGIMHSQISMQAVTMQ